MQALQHSDFYRLGNLPDIKPLLSVLTIKALNYCNHFMPPGLCLGLPGWVSTRMV